MLKIVDKNARCDAFNEKTGKWEPAQEIEFHYGAVARLVRFVSKLLKGKKQ